MRKKLTATITAIAVLATAATALAVATIPVAIFAFTDPNEANSFQKTAAAPGCVKKVRAQAALGINVGDSSPACVFRTSVVADSGNTAPSQEIQATVTYEKKTSAKIRRKLYLSVLTRISATGHFELRIVPTKQRWTVIRDPDGPAPAANLASGILKSIKPGATKPNSLLLRSFAGSGGASTVLAQVNGLTVYNASDVAPSQPTGKFNGIAVGHKTGAAATGMKGSFDDITVRVPSPF